MILMGLRAGSPTDWHAPLIDVDGSYASMSPILLAWSSLGASVSTLRGAPTRLAFRWDRERASRLNFR